MRADARNDLYCVEWGVKLYSLTHSEAALTPFTACDAYRYFAGRAAMLMTSQK